MTCAVCYSGCHGSRMHDFLLCSVPKLSLVRFLMIKISCVVLLCRVSVQIAGAKFQVCLRVEVWYLVPSASFCIPMALCHLVWKIEQHRHGEHPRSSSASLLEGVCVNTLHKQWQTPNPAIKSFAFLAMFEPSCTIYTLLWHTFAHFAHIAPAVLDVLICRICGEVKRSGWKRPQNGMETTSTARCHGQFVQSNMTDALNEVWPSCWKHFETVGSPWLTPGWNPEGPAKKK